MKLLPRALILSVGLLVVLAVGRQCFIELRKANLYESGQTAMAAGQWPEAFKQFRAVVELDPNYRDVRKHLAEVIPQLILTVVGGKDPAAEIELLRWLSASGDDARLVEVLDRSAVPVVAGEFLMGSSTERPDERPQHLVYLDAFEIDRYEVTNAQYQRFLKATGRSVPSYWSGADYPAGQADYPVVGVFWDDADAYCTWAGKRLPTEAEWEKACRGTDGRIYPWGNNWDPNRANVDVSIHEPNPGQGEYLPFDDARALLPLAGQISKGPRLQPVGSYLQSASPYGVMDLVGNASEWIADYYNWSDYSNVSDRNPRVLAPPWNHCLRGSAWYDLSGAKGWARDQSRCSARNSSHGNMDPRVGFRCASSLSPSGQ